jgi:hypothetical protein
VRARHDDGGPDIPDRAPSDLVESVLALLEGAGVPTEVNDKVVALIEEWEFCIAAAADGDFPEPAPDDPHFDESWEE